MANLSCSGVWNLDEWIPVKSKKLRPFLWLAIDMVLCLSGSDSTPGTNFADPLEHLLSKILLPIFTSKFVWSKNLSPVSLSVSLSNSNLHGAQFCVENAFSFFFKSTLLLYTCVGRSESAFVTTVNCTLPKEKRKCCVQMLQHVITSCWKHEICFVLPAAFSGVISSVMARVAVCSH